MKNKKFMSRTLLRYAIEKFPKDLRAKGMEKWSGENGRIHMMKSLTSRYSGWRFILPPSSDFAYMFHFSTRAYRLNPGASGICSGSSGGGTSL
jgi:hypothetical protein